MTFGMLALDVIPELDPDPLVEPPPLVTLTQTSLLPFFMQRMSMLPT
jgi:hypothetical protein